VTAEREHGVLSDARGSLVLRPRLTYPAGETGSAAARSVIARSVRTVVSMSWMSNWLSSRVVGPAMYSRRLRCRASPSAVRLSGRHRPPQSFDRLSEREFKQLRRIRERNPSA
jgi:hypothetical protein